MISGHFLIFAVDDLTVRCSAVNVAEPDFTSHRIGVGLAVGLSAHPAPAPARVWALEPRQVPGPSSVLAWCPGETD